MEKTRSTIRFSEQLPKAGGLVAVPVDAGKNFPGDAAPTIEATLNGFPFRAGLESVGKSGYSLRITQTLLVAAGADPEASVTIEITRVNEEAETRVPADLDRCLSASALARETWEAITPAARRDWILWISSAKQMETRRRRIENACDMLASGKRRVCCFGGMAWLRKDHPKAGQAWLQLPREGKGHAHGSDAAHGGGEL